MKQTARLIIPLWGETYASKLVSMTLPALLAPGNLPTLCTMFDVELVVVTETALFEVIGGAKSFRRVAELCRCRFVSLDDLMTDIPGDYGVVLTHALYRGFVDLGAQMTETYLLFLNADFIICDGALRHVGELMQQGKRVIHAPSFRVVLEEIWPKLRARVDPATATLSLSAREMVKLALEHKHLTVKARIVNQRLCHQIWMDQFYWHVDDDTLIGYQWPVALVAIKPQRAVSEPTLVWDYAFIPDAAPTAERHFIDDSDHFFMLEPQKRMSGEEMVRLGWISVEEIARNLSKWTTKEQRECGTRLLKFHARDLPSDVGEFIEQSRAYMAQVTSRLSPTPQPHIGHGHLGAWFEGAKERMKARRQQPRDAQATAAAAAASGASSVQEQSPARIILRALRAVYRASFGSPPEVGPFHPLWLDTRDVVQKVAEWKRDAARILWLTARDSLFHRILHNRLDAAILLDDETSDTLFGEAPYDACLCELTADQVAALKRLYGRIRPLMRNGGEVIFLVSGKHHRLTSATDVELCETAFPDTDVSEIVFFGSAASERLRRIYLRASNSFPNRPVARVIATGAVLIGLAPLVRLANASASRRDPSIFTPHWTTLLVRFAVRKRRAAEAGSPCARDLPCGGERMDAPDASLVLR